MITSITISMRRVHQPKNPIVTYRRSDRRPAAGDVKTVKGVVLVRQQKYMDGYGLASDRGPVYEWVPMDKARDYERGIAEKLMERPRER